MPAPNRWAPWIEPTALASANTTLNSGATATIPGISIEVIPHIDTMIAVHMVADVDCTVAPPAGAGNNLVVELNVNGSAIIAPTIIYKNFTVGSRVTATQIVTLSLSKETSYTLTMTARIGGFSGATTYLVRLNHTTMTVVGMPKIHL